MHIENRAIDWRTELTVNQIGFKRFAIGEQLSPPALKQGEFVLFVLEQNSLGRPLPRSLCITGHLPSLQWNLRVNSADLLVKCGKFRLDLRPAVKDREDLTPAHEITFPDQQRRHPR